MAKRTHLMQRSFAGGILAEDMLGRIDNDKYPAGLRECENFIVTPQGPAKNRAGFAFIMEVNDSTEAARIVPFSFSDDQTYIVVLNNGKAAFSTDGGAVSSAAQTIVSVTLAAACVLEITAHGRVEGDVIYVNSVDGFDRYSYKVGVVIGVNTFYVLHMDGSAVDSRLFAAYVSGGTIQAVYTVTVPYTAAQLFDIGYAQSADVMTLTHQSHAVRELSRLGAASWSLSSVTFAPTISAPTGLGISESAAASGVDYSYVVTAVASNGLEESLASSAATINSDLASAKITVTWSAVTGAVRYNVYREKYGLHGFIGSTDDLTFTDDNITPDVSLTPPIANNPFGSADNYPATVCYFEQRRGFGSTVNLPSTVWLTQSATESNLTSSIPSQDNDAIQLRIAARELNNVRHLLPMSDLLMLTSSSAWMITSRDSNALSPSNIMPREQSHTGANKVHPVLAENAGIYAQAVGGHLKSVTLSPDNNGGYVADDLSILAADLFDGYDIVDLAYASAPLQTIWAVRSDGVLLGMTYYPEHKVFGWHTHTTDGVFESIACIRENGEDVLYAIIGRSINGRYCRYLERMHSRVDADIAVGVFSDAAHIYAGASTSTLTGLWHLEGKTVNVLANGAASRKTVANGSITLDEAATYVIVGLPYTSRITSMPLVADNLPAGGSGLLKQINELLVRVKHSSAIRAGVPGGELREMPARSNEPYGTAPALKSGVYRIPLDAEWGYDAQYVIEHSAPLPCTIVSALAVTTFSES